MTDAAMTVITLQHALYNNVKEEDVQQHEYLFEFLWNKAIRAENRTRWIEEGIEHIETILFLRQCCERYR